MSVVRRYLGVTKYFVISVVILIGSLSLESSITLDLQFGAWGIGGLFFNFDHGPRYTSMYYYRTQC